jgi:hypothetical protein
VRAGAEIDAAKDRRLRAGLQWEPTPVPDQTGRSSYVDNDRIVASVGGGHDFGLFKRPVTLNWVAALHHLLPRATDKAPQARYRPCDQPGAALCDEVPDDTKNPATGQAYPAAQGLQTGNPGFPGFASSGSVLVVGAELLWEL